MRKLLAASVMMLAAAPAAAQIGEATVTAKNPQGIVRALEAAGYEATLEVDGQGDPMIATELSGWSARIYFYGCDETTNAGCDSVQFSAGFDRKQPWTAADALTLSAKYRFASVRLDDEGDPYIMWDVITGDGIPAKVFLSSVLHFSDAIDNVVSVVFAGEETDS